MRRGIVCAFVLALFAAVGIYSQVTSIPAASSSGSGATTCEGLSDAGTACKATAPAGAILGTTDTQTVTGKTIDGVTPTIMGYLDATSSIQTQLNGAATLAGANVFTASQYYGSTGSTGSKWVIGSGQLSLETGNGSDFAGLTTGQISINNGHPINVTGGYQCNHGTNNWCGVAALSGGTVTVSTNKIGALAAAGGGGFAVKLTLETCSTCGTLSVGTVTNGTSFVVNSTNASDASSFYWQIDFLN